jgi:uncharacterized membrane protein YhhN
VPPALLILSAVVAIADWVTVARQWFRAECVLKPLTLALLIAAAARGDLGVAQPWVLAALALSLVGDVALLRDDDVAFLVGLAAFLLGHVCYLVAFARTGVNPTGALVGAVVAVVVSAAVLPRVLRGAAATEGTAFAVVVGGYAAVLGTMTAFGVGTGILATAAGAVLFLASDTVLAWERFVGALPRGPLIVIVTYHLAQLLIVGGLIGAA